MKNPYQYVVLRCVPRPDREEFLNVGVVLYCEDASFLEVQWRVDEARLRAVAPDLQVARVTAALEHAAGVCAGDRRAGVGADRPLGSRFGLLKAPRSTVIQPGPVHGGLTEDPARTLGHLLERLVG